MDDVTGFFNEGYLPPTNFYFSVKFNGRPDMDSSFQEVSGLKVTMAVEEREAGGENTFVHRLPTAPKYENLVLKRCLLSSSALEAWCQRALENLEFAPLHMKISLLGAHGESLASWNVIGAYPVSWELSTLNSSSNELAIETLELKYRHFKRER